MNESIPVPVRVLTILIIVGLIVWQIILRWRKITPQPDPWDSEIENSVQQSDAVEVCHRCFTLQPDNAWFCEHCGSAVGPYNNLMPYVKVFSEGEVYRNSMSDKHRSNALVAIGYALIFIPTYVGLMVVMSFGIKIMATVYCGFFWFLLFKNFKRQHAEKISNEPPDAPHLEPSP